MHHWCFYFQVTVVDHELADLLQAEGIHFGMLVAHASEARRLWLEVAESGALRHLAAFRELSRGLKAAGEPREEESGSLALELQAAPGGEPGAAVFEWAVENGLVVLEMERRRLSLEEIFVRLTQEGGSK